MEFNSDTTSSHSEIFSIIPLNGASETQLVSSIPRSTSKEVLPIGSKTSVLEQRQLQLPEGELYPSHKDGKKSGFNTIKIKDFINSNLEDLLALHEIVDNIGTERFQYLMRTLDTESGALAQATEKTQQQGGSAKSGANGSASSETRGSAEKNQPLSRSRRIFNVVFNMKCFGFNN